MADLRDIYKLNGNSFNDFGYNLSSQYAGMQGYLDAYHRLADQQWGNGSYDRPALTRRLDSVLNNFSSQFQNLVGRAPTQEEIGKYLNNGAADVILGSPGGQSENNSVGVNNDITTFLNNNFRQTAQDYAQSQLEKQQGAANDLSNLFRKQGNEALSNVENSLLDYQNKLFEKLRPNLITSLQAQGLLNTGGLNQAVAGAQKDLADSGTQYLADKRLDMENQANQIAFSGASAPYEYKMANITGQVPWLQQMGQTAQDQGFKTYMDNLDYQHQLGLLAQQNKYLQDSKPSFLQNLGTSFSTSLGTNLGSWFAPNAGADKQGNGGNYAKLAAVL